MPIIPAVPIEERFWPHVDKSGDCWVWTGFTDKKGYGRFKPAYLSNGPSAAHRHALAFALGRPLLPGMQALHACDNPPCVRNDTVGVYEIGGIKRELRGHLWEGTNAENTLDRDLKGRQTTLRGSANITAKLTEETVLDIRALACRGVTQRDIGRMHGVSQATIQRIVARKTWTHV